MRLVDTPYLLLAVFFQASLFAASAQAASTDQPEVFSSQEAANNYIKQAQAQGKQTSLTVQRQDKQRYSVIFKGYLRWSDAIKQASLLEKRGYSNLEVVRGRFERDYSIIVLQSLNKKAVGVTFNRLRSMGMKNVKVHTDKIKRVRYVVMTHEPLKIKRKKLIAKPEISRPVHTEKIVLQEPIVVPIETAVIPVEPALMITDDELEEDDIIIVMSESSDITNDIFLAEEDDPEVRDFEWSIDKLQLETELFTRSASPVDHIEYINAAGHARWNINNQWEVQIAARVDGNYQHGKGFAESDELDLDYGNNYLRYRDKSMTITMGADTVRWGKVDNFAPTDNMATLDLSRGVLYKWGEAYRAAPVIRSEFFLEQGKLDIVYLPFFREAELPDKENVWYPVNSNRGSILGFGENQQLKELLQNGKIDDDIDETDGGFGFRFSSTYGAFDYDLVLQKVKLSTPYYQLNPIIQADPAAAASERYAFKEVHPRSWVVGADIAFQAADMLVRIEGAWFSDLPATTETLVYKTYHGFKWAGGVELYPGDGDTRVNVQLTGVNIEQKEKIVDRDNIVSLSGEVETLFSNNRWKFSGQFNLGLDEKDIYLSPEISYLGWEPFEFYSAIHYLDGDDNTLGGFYKENTMITFGWRGKY